MQPPSPRRNVMLVSFDDAVAIWKYKALFGELLQTPNLDRICARSTAFHAAYTQAPVCGPSRASFMSGKTPFQSGVMGHEKSVFDRIPPQDMWPWRLRQAGYFCSSGGKVHHGFVPLPQEAHEVLYCDEPKAFRVDWRVPPKIRVELGGFRNGYATADERHDGRFYDHQSADSAIAFLKGFDGSAPFYREVGFYGPHGPWITPRRFKDMYDIDRIEAPRAWLSGFDKSPFIDRVSPENIDMTRWRHWKKSLRNYFSALTHADHHLGRVWDALKASPHADNTLVVILSDHGMHLGDHARFRKSTLWKQVANVPLIIHDPDNPVPNVVTDPVALLDVGPTILDFLGLDPIGDCVGRSLRPQMALERVPDRAVPTFLDYSAGVRFGKYRFIRYEDGTTQFYDLSQDWWQTRDLGPAHPAYDEMREVHAACCREYGLDPDAAEETLNSRTQARPRRTKDAAP